MADRSIMTTLKLNVQDFVAGTRTAHKSLDDLVKASGKADQAATTGLGRMQQSMELRRNDWNTASSALLKVGAAQGVVTAAVAATGVQYNMLQQTSRAALTTLLGGAKAANAQMDRLDAFAKTSPFSKATFIQAQQQMLAFGIEAKKVIPYLDSIQNAVAAAGGNDTALRGIVEIMAKIKSSAKITGQDLMQFGNWGVDAAGLIGDAMGKTGAEIRTSITEGTIGADEALDALAKGMGTKFDGAAANVKNTLAGAFDRVKAAFRDLSSDIMEPFVGKQGGGIFTGFLNQVADVLRWVQQLPAPIRDTGAALFALSTAGALGVGALMKMIPAAVDTHKAFFNLANDGIPVLSKAIARFQAVPGHLKNVGSQLGAIGADWRNYMGQVRIVAADGSMQTATLASTVRSNMGRVGGAVKSAGSALLGAFGGPVGIAIMGTVAAVTTFANQAAEARSRAEEFANTLDEVTGAATRASREWAINEIVKSGSGAEAFKRLGLDINEVGDAVSRMDIARLKEMRASIDGLDFRWGDKARVQGDLERIIQGVEDGKRVADEYAEGMAGASGATDEFGNSVEGATGLTQEQTKALEEAAERAEAYREGLQNLADWQRAQADSQWAANDALAKFRETIGEVNGETIDWAGGLDLATESGRKNQAALDALGKSTYDTIQAMVNARDANGQYIYSEAEVYDVLAQGQQALADGYEIATGGAEDFKEQAAAVAEQLGLTPEQVEVLFMLRGAEEVPETLAAIKDLIDGFPPEVIAQMKVMGVEEASASIDGVTALLDAGVSGEHVAELLANDNATDVVNLAVDLLKSGYSIDWLASLIAEDKAYPGVAKPLIDRLRTEYERSFMATLTVDDRASGTISSVRNMLDSLKSKEIMLTTTHNTRYTTSGSSDMGRSTAYASGGAVFGPGTTTSDSILARLSNQEHVVTAREVGAIGGHQNMYALRSMMRSGQLKQMLGFAGGGSPAMRTAPAQSFTFPVSVPAAAPVVNVDLDGLSVTGRFEIGRDGLATLVDGHIQQWLPKGGY